MIRYNTCSLTPESIDRIIAGIEEYMAKIDESSADTARVRLALEEILIRISQNPASYESVRIGYGKRFGRHSLHILYEGEAFNPTDSDEDDWSSRLLMSLGLSPVWAYRSKTNHVSLSLKERNQKSALVRIIIALIASVIFGICGTYIPDSIRENIQKLLLEPISSAFLGLLNTFAGFMIAFTICSGILGMGSTESLKTTGKSILLRYIMVSFLFSTATTLLVLPFFHLNMSVATGFSVSHLEQVSGMLFNILPTDPVTPFSSGNTMQIIVIAVLIGIVLLSLGEKTRHISRIVDEGACALQRATGIVCSLIPVFVFVELTDLIWEGKASQLLSLWKPLGIGLILLIIYSLILLLLTAYRIKMPPKELFRHIFPAFFTGLTTASSVATLPMSMEICGEKLGVDKTVLKFAYPIGNVICKYGTLSYICIICISLAATYNVEVNIPWLIMAIISTTLLTSAVAPVPGAILTIYTILIAQLHIPSEGVLIAVTLDIIVDYVGAGFNSMLLILETTSAARKLRAH